MAIVNSTPSFETKFSFPLQGCWVCTTLTDTKLEMGEACHIDFLGREFTGTVVDVQEQEYLWYSRILPGKGFQKLLPLKPYSGSSLEAMAREACSQAGETVSTKSLFPSTRKDWIRTEGLLAPTLSRLGLIWKCLSDGTVCFGTYEEPSEGEWFFYKTWSGSKVTQVLLDSEAFVRPGEDRIAVEYYQCSDLLQVMVQYAK